MRFPLQVPSYLKLPTFLWTTALQRKLSCSSFAPYGAMEDWAAGRCPPIVRLLGCHDSFHFQLSG